MSLTLDADACRAWYEARVGLKTHPETVFIGCGNSGKLATVVAFSHYRPDTDIELGIAHDGKGLGSRELIRAVFSYVFGQSNCLRCTARIRDDNVKSIKLVERLGFSQEGRLRRGFGDRDALIYGLLRDNTPWHPQATPPRHPIRKP